MKTILLIAIFLNVTFASGQTLNDQEYQLNPKSTLIPAFNEIKFVTINDDWLANQSIEILYNGFRLNYTQWETQEPLKETTLSFPNGTGREQRPGGKIGQLKFAQPVFKNFFLGAGVEISKDDVTGEIYIYDFFGKYNFGNLNFMASASLKDLKNFYNSRIIITYAAKSSVEIIFAGNFNKDTARITANLGFEIFISQKTKWGFSYLVPSKIIFTNLKLPFKKMFFDLGFGYNFMADFTVTRISGSFRF